MICLGIDGRDAFASQPRGIGKALATLTRHFLPLIPEWSVMMYTNRSSRGEFPAPARTRYIDMHGDRWNLWERVRLPLATLVDRLHILHCPSQTMPPVVSCPVVLTVHDIIPIRMGDGLPAGDVQKFKNALERSVKKARRIIAVSEFTKKDLLSVFNIPDKKVDVVSWGVNKIVGGAEQKEICRMYGIRAPYFIAFGGEAPRKNVPRILEAFAQFTHDTTDDFQLVLVGVTPFAARKFSSIADRLGISKQVILLSYLDDATVSEVMRRSEALVYSSLYEGFGLPILEAMAVGTPVITSNVTSMPEIAGDAALLVDPGDAGSIADAMRECFSNSSLRADLKARGLRRIEDFSWEHAARRTVDVYRQAL